MRIKFYFINEFIDKFYKDRNIVSIIQLHIFKDKTGLMTYIGLFGICICIVVGNRFLLEADEWIKR